MIEPAIATAPQRPLTLPDFLNWHAGGTMVVCGCGESLNDFHAPERFITIGVNDIGRLFHPNYLVVLNPAGQFTGDRFRYVEATGAEYVFTQLKELRIPRAQIIRFRLGRYGGTDFSDPAVLPHTQNSPYVALCLAVHMGAKRIGLIGVDFGDHHFFGKTGPHTLSRQLERINEQYQRLGKALEARSVEVFNLSPISRLTAFPQLPAAEFTALASTDQPASCAGKGTEERLRIHPGSEVPRTEAGAAAPTSGKSRAKAQISPKVFVVNYHFLACGNVFGTGLRHGAQELGVAYQDALWDDPQLPARVEQFNPDLILVVHGRRFVQKWKDSFRSYHTAVWLLDEPYEVDDTARWSEVFQAVFVNDPNTIKRHGNAHYLPVGFDRVAHQDNHLKRIHKAGFIGGPNKTREHYLNEVARLGLLSYVVGGPWRSQVLRDLCLETNIAPEGTAGLYRQTQVVVNVFRDRHHFNREGVPGWSMNPRIYEALACGALVLSEERPEIGEVFPELPTFNNPSSMAEALERLLADEPYRAGLLEKCRVRLKGHSYSDRLVRVLQVCLGIDCRPEFGRQSSGEEIARVPAIRAAPRPENAPPGWTIRGEGVETAASEEIISITCNNNGGPRDGGLISELPSANTELAFEVQLGKPDQFLAGILALEEQNSRDYLFKIVCASDGDYLECRGDSVEPLEVRRNVWQAIKITWFADTIRLALNGRVIALHKLGRIHSGRWFVGSSAGLIKIRNISLINCSQWSQETESIKETCLKEWLSYGDSAKVNSNCEVLLLKPPSSEPGSEKGLLSLQPYNDIELSFDLWLDPDTWFIAKIHQTEQIDQKTNSYHIVSEPESSYVAKHHCILGQLPIRRRLWQKITFRWVDQLIEVRVGEARTFRQPDNHLQSGYCFIGVKGGLARLRNIQLTDLSGIQAVQPDEAEGGSIRREDRCIAALPGKPPKPGRESWPFTQMPRRNLIYHIWPVRGSMWTWNLDQLKQRLDIFNGHRILGIVHDQRSEPPERVQEYLEGHGFEFVIRENGGGGEAITFPRMMNRVASENPNDLTFYGHAKGVKYEPKVPWPVRRWAEVQYRVALDDWLTVRTHLQKFAMTGMFKMSGRFRAHRYLADWHYSGTFFWMRNAQVFARGWAKVHDFYGGVETWPGTIFRKEETACLFMDNLRELPYHEDFWRRKGAPAFMRWESGLRYPPPPGDLLKPSPFKGYTSPRMEQKPEEFEWWVDLLLKFQVSRVLTIGANEGGLEWHLAREFFEHGRNIEITAIEMNPTPQLFEILRDAEHRFQQSIELVISDSMSAASRLTGQYDAVFIDGDHSYRVCASDFALAESLQPRLIGLHDIVDSDWHAIARCCVSRLWAELSGRYRTEHRASGEWGGIGVVFLEP